MSSLLLQTIDQLSREKGIEQQIIISAVKDAILVAARKYYKTAEELRSELNRETGQIELFAVKKAVENVVNPAREISLEAARELDPQAVLPGATITITHVDTGISRTLVTDDQGRYRAPQLALGNYELRAELSGFQTAVRKGITLAVGQEAIVNLILQVGQVTEVVEVLAEAPLIEMTTSSISGLVDDKKIRDLPLNGRSFEQLAFLQTGVTPYLRGGRAIDQGAGMKFSVGGGRLNSNSFLLDGISINDQAGATPGSAAGNLLGVEMLREFRVLTSTFSAEYGRSSGGVIMAVTKSGTNELHGSTFYFHRNDNLDARNFFDLGDAPEFKRNQFGFTLGGPLRRDRSFFFGGYEGLRERLGLSHVAVVPNARAHQGFLPGERFVGVDARVNPFLDLFPLPNGGREFADGTGQFFSNPSKPTDEDYFTVRWDHKFSDADFFFVRYTFDDGLRSDPIEYPNITVDHETRTQYPTIEWTRLFSPTLLNVIRFGYNRSFGEDANVPHFEVTDPLLFLPGQGLGRLTFTGVGITAYGGEQGNPRTFAHNFYQVGDDVTITRGSHSIKVGVGFDRIQSNTLIAREIAGAYEFGTLEDFLRAAPRQFSGELPGTDSRRGWRQIMLGFYVQDDIRARPNLTLNLGLRYEFATVPTEVNGKLANYPQPTINTAPVLGDPWYEGSFKDFGPRVGFSWDPWSDAKTAIRGGFGLYFDHIVGRPYNVAMARIPPFHLLAQLPTPSFPRPDLSGVRTDLRRISSYGVDLKQKDPTRAAFSLQVQRELVPGTSVSVAYVGSRSYHMVGANSANRALPQILPDGRKFFLAGTPFRNPNLGEIQSFIYTGGNAYYHSLQVSVNRRFSQGLQFQSSYTFSRNINDSDGVLANELNLAAGSLPQDPDNRGADRGLASWDVRHLWSFNFTYDLPFARNLSGGAGKVFSGWQLNGISTLSSGTPFTVSVGHVRSRNGATGSGPDRPNLRPGFSNNPLEGASAGCPIRPGGPLLYAGSKLGSPDLYFDPCAFELPEIGTFGNLGRNTVIGPGLVNFDFSLVKNTAVGENRSLQFRAEFFNLFNRANFSRPALTRTFDRTEARIASTGVLDKTLTTSRQIQFGLKFVF